MTPHLLSRYERAWLPWSQRNGECTWKDKSRPFIPRSLRSHHERKGPVKAVILSL